MTNVPLPLEQLSDYTDGRDLMLKILGRMSAIGIIDYAESAGPQLDRLIADDGHDYYQGMREGLATSVDKAIARVPLLSCSWKRVKECAPIASSDS